VEKTLDWSCGHLAVYRAGQAELELAVDVALGVEIDLARDTRHVVLAHVDIGQVQRASFHVKSEVALSTSTPLRSGSPTIQRDLPSHGSTLNLRA